jgi:cation diffusion facilitator family transporter
MVPMERAGRDTDDDILTRDVGGMRRSLLAYVLVLALKLVAYLFSGAIVLLAEALHSISDIAIAVFLLVAARMSRRAADEDHVFGHDRAQNVAALVAATLLIAFTTFQVYREAVPLLWQPHNPDRHLPLALGVLGACMLITAWPLLGLLRHKRRGPSAKAQLVDLVNDELGLTAALIGMVFVLAGYPLGDPIAAMVVGAVIGTNAVLLFRENFIFLLGRSPDAAFLARLGRAAASVEGVVGIHDLLAEYIGPRAIRVSVHVVVDGAMPVAEADRIAEEVEERMCELPECRFCLVHLDAARAGKGDAHGVETRGA